MKKYVEIEYVHAREVLDCDYKPAIEVEVHTENGEVGRAIVSSYETKCDYCARSIRDGDKSRYNGNGLLNAVNHINSVIASEIEGLNVLNQSEIDETLIDLDGTENKSKLGANAILAVSIATSKAAACNLEIPLYQHLGGISGRNIPTPMMNVLKGKNFNFMIVPIGVDFFSEKIRMCVEVNNKIKINNDLDDEEAIQLIMQSIKDCGYKDKVSLAINRINKQEELESDSLMSLYEKWIEKYPIVSIEDGFEPNDWESWSTFTAKMNNKIQISGGELFMTNIDRLKKGIDCKSANGIIIDLNQIGTITEAIDIIRMAKSHGYSCTISGINGESEDAFLADFSVGLNTKYIKINAESGNKSAPKINRLLRIEEMMS